MGNKNSVCGLELKSSYYPLVVLASVLLGILNSVIGNFNSYVLHLPLFLDTIGTLVSTALFGLVPGLITAVVTHITPTIVTLWETGNFFPFVICSMASALTLWIFMKHGKFDNLLHAILVSVVVTLANAVTGSAVAVFFFSGITNHPVDYMMTGFLSIGQNLLSAAFWARIPVNLIDKGIAVFIAFGVYKWCLYRKRRSTSEED